MEFEYDEAAWPIVVARWRKSHIAADVFPALRKMDEWLARGQRFGLLIDSRGADAMSPEQRSHFIEHIKANASLTKERLVQALVIDNLVHRTLFYGVNLIFPLPFLNKVFAEPEAARHWLEVELGLVASVHHGA